MTTERRAEDEPQARVTQHARHCAELCVAVIEWGSTAVSPTKLWGEMVEDATKKIAALIADVEEQTRRDCAERVAALGDVYPTDIFEEPPVGEHAKTVDGCSARALRWAAKAWAKELRGGAAALPPDEWQPTHLIWYAGRSYAVALDPLRGGPDNAGLAYSQHEYERRVRKTTWELRDDGVWVLGDVPVDCTVRSVATIGPVRTQWADKCRHSPSTVSTTYSHVETPPQAPAKPASPVQKDEVLCTKACPGNGSPCVLAEEHTGGCWCGSFECSCKSGFRG
jgi:hypothetical protein